MSRRYALLVVLLMVLGIAVGTTQAQSGGSNVAFVNNSGQLIVTDGGGQMRWIVTNPGELLAEPLGFTWSRDGGQLFFAVNAGGTVSLRVGSVANQSYSEIGQISGTLSGGEWLRDGQNVVIASDDRLLLFPAAGGGPQTLLSGGGPVALHSPYADTNPNLPAASSVSPDGRTIFLWRNGRYAIYALNGGGVFDLPGENDSNAHQSGLWSADAPLVAYWGFANGSSVLSVTNAANNQTITLNSGRSTPITPLAWRPGTRQLVYRDSTNFVRLADVSCLDNGCATNPLESGVELLPATASDVQIPAGDWVFFRDGGAVQALNLNCVQAGNCVGSAATLGQKAAPRTWVHVVGATLTYTAYTQDPNNANDREVRVVNLNCLSDPASCQAESLLLPAVAGLLSPDGAYVVVDEAGAGLEALHIPSLNLAYLSGSMGGALGNGLQLARWG